MRCALRGILNNLFSSFKKMVFADQTVHRKIKFGIASGMLYPINRRSGLRTELGLYERGVAGYFLKLAAGCNVGYDIGSYLGYYVLAMAKQHVNKIYAFDPDKNCMAGLKNMLSYNKVGAQVYLVDFFISNDNGPNMSSIDRLVENGNITPPDFVKIDVEGAELEVLQGMLHTIAITRPSFIVETHTKALEEACVKFLSNINYAVRSIDIPPLLKWISHETRTGHNRWIVARAAERAER